VQVDTTNVTDDPRWQLVNATMRKYGYSAHSLIETLHTVQSAYGYLNHNVVRYIAKVLVIPPSKVYGVATFYHLFTFNPPAEHRCVVCTGTACHIKGAGQIMTAVEHTLGIKAGEIRSDKRVSLEVVRCIGACDPAPLAIFDEEVVGHLTPETVQDYIENWMNHDS
jgi:bidirectional [NiFe] hydrogenase diaphorase subunit